MIWRQNTQCSYTIVKCAGSLMPECFRDFEFKEVIAVFVSGGDANLCYSENLFRKWPVW
jgi:hypothetical protein